MEVVPWGAANRPGVTSPCGPAVIDHFPTAGRSVLGALGRPPRATIRAMSGFSFSARIGDAVDEPRSLLRPVVVLAALVVLAAGVAAAQGLVATVAFGALAAVVCRQAMLGLQRRGVGRGAAVGITGGPLALILGSRA